MAVCEVARFPVPAATVQLPFCTQTLVRKSRFLAQTARIAGREEALAFVEEIRKAHPDATHNCWAFVAGAPGDSAQVGSSDDGEPRGTAGRPMLTVLLHCGIGQICVVVSRWFGGIKLGTGGLARAYQEAVTENVKILPVECAIPRANWHLTVKYTWLPALQKLLPDFEAQIKEQSYGEDASLLISVPLDKQDALNMAIAHISNGKVQLKSVPVD